MSVRCREQNATCGDQGECVQPDISVVIAREDGGIAEDVAAGPLDATSGRTDAGSQTQDVPLDLPIIPNIDVQNIDIQNIDVRNVDVPNVDVPNVDVRLPVDLFPRPITPMSLSDVSLRRPTLRWALPVGADGAMVELCRDRACTLVIETLRVPGTSIRPAMPLPPRSVVFWRLRATIVGVTLMTYSPTWLFHVPARDNSGSIDTSANPHLDLNGDGFDDLAVAARSADPGGRVQAGTVSVYYGSAMGIPMAPTRILEGVDPVDQFGMSVASAGDVNGDGFGDLVVGAPLASIAGSRAGTASVFHGSAMGIPMNPARVLDGLAPEDYFGSAVASAVDTPQSRPWRGWSLFATRNEPLMFARRARTWRI